MGGDDQGMLKGLQELDELAAGLGVEIGARLIHDQDGRGQGQDRGDGHGALFPAGQMVRRAVLQVDGAHRGQGLHHLFVHLLGAQAQI